MKKTLIRMLSLLIALTTIFSLVSCSFVEDMFGEIEDKTDKSKDDEDDSDGSDNSKDDDKSGGVKVTKIKLEEDDEIESDDLCYVMIYNPKVYDENRYSDNTVLNTGDFGNQIEVGGSRGDGLTEDAPPYVSFSQSEINANIPWDKVNLDGNRGDPLGYDYDEGDTREFYCYSGGNVYSRNAEEFECVYAGKYCYIWSTGAMDEDDIEEYGEDFDEDIYKEVSETFGTPRFVGESGKVNLLFYSMPSGYGGCFCMADIFAEGELSESEINSLGANTNHAILHINADYAKRSDCSTWMHGTMAHELQHLICGSNYFYTVNETLCRTWLNESMSGYIEEKLYPGAKEEGGHLDSFLESDLIRRGQSMYNFTTGYDDIGVYGSVYYFAEYMTEAAGNDVFTDVHDYWRDSYSETLCEAEALINSVSKSFKKKIKNSVSYPEELAFENSDEEWMSKLILNFYLYLLADEDELDAFEHIEQDELVYDDLESAMIEGGGRIIVAVKDDEFAVPEDADSGLIYIGLDKNFEPVGEAIYN